MAETRRTRGQTILDGSILFAFYLLYFDRHDLLTSALLARRLRLQLTGSESGLTLSKLMSLTVERRPSAAAENLHRACDFGIDPSAYFKLPPDRVVNRLRAGEYSRSLLSFGYGLPASK